eukprot:scaffold3877_cov219-Pinguiococcus_pyrenoidosus.AAC.2
MPTSGRISSMRNGSADSLSLVFAREDSHVEGKVNNSSRLKLSSRGQTTPVRSTRRSRQRLGGIWAEHNAGRAADVSATTPLASLRLVRWARLLRLPRDAAQRQLL